MPKMSFEQQQAALKDASERLDLLVQSAASPGRVVMELQHVRDRLTMVQASAEDQLVEAARAGAL